MTPALRIRLTAVGLQMLNRGEPITFTVELLPPGEPDAGAGVPVTPPVPALPPGAPQPVAGQTAHDKRWRSDASRTTVSSTPGGVE